MEHSPWIRQGLVFPKLCGVASFRAETPSTRWTWRDVTFCPCGTAVLDESGVPRKSSSYGNKPLDWVGRRKEHSTLGQRCHFLFSTWIQALASCSFVYELYWNCNVLFRDMNWNKSLEIDAKTTAGRRKQHVSEIMEKIITIVVVVISTDIIYLFKQFNTTKSLAQPCQAMKTCLANHQIMVIFD